MPGLPGRRLLSYIRAVRRLQVSAPPAWGRGLGMLSILVAMLLPSTAAAKADDWPDVSGKQRRAVLMCRFSDSPTPSLRDKAYFQGLFGPGKGLSGYYDEASYGKIDFTPTVHDWKTIGPRASFGIDGDTSTGGQDADAIFNACTAAHDTEVDFHSVDGIDLILDESQDIGPSLGGSHLATLDGVNDFWPWTMIGSRYDEVGDQPDDAALFAHEIGHSFGLPHTVGKGIKSHGFDPMGFTCGWGFFTGDFDPDYDCLPVHYLAAHKDLLGWIPKSRRFTLSPQKKRSRATRKVTIERVARPAGNKNPLIARFPVPGKPATFYTAEARMEVGNFDSDVNLADDGVVITKVVLDCQGTPQCQFDFTPTEVQGIDKDQNGFLDPESTYTRGETFRKGKLKIKVVKKLPHAFKLEVTNRK